MTRRSSCENCEQETWEEPTPQTWQDSLFVDISVEFGKYWESDKNIQITTLVVWWGTLPTPRLDQTPVRQQFHILEEEQHNLSWYRGGARTLARMVWGKLLCPDVRLFLGRRKGAWQVNLLHWTQLITTSLQVQVFLLIYTLVQVVQVFLLFSLLHKL